MNDDLIIRFFEKQTTKKEALVVLKWIEASNENKEYYKRLHDIWIMIQMDAANETDVNQINLIMEQIERRKIKRRIVWAWAGGAAAILILLLSLNYFLIDKAEENFDYESLIGTTHPSKEITITMNSYNNIQRKEYRTITLQDSIVNVNYNNKGLVTINDTLNIETETVMNTIRVPFGKRSVLVLEDGTKVHINSGSTLIYPTVFSEKERRVFLEGEAFFDVETDVERKFIVQTYYKSIEVLGTSFNVSIDKDIAVFEAVLVNGRIALGTESIQTELLPNECYTYQASTKEETIVKVDVTNYTSWVEGKLKFRKEPMYKAIKKLEKVYNIKIKLKDNKYLQSLVSGELNLKDSAEETMNILMSIVAPKNYSKRDSIFEISFND